MRLVLTSCGSPTGWAGNKQETCARQTVAVDRQEEFVLRTLEERDIRFVRLWFTDVLGYLKSVAVAPRPSSARSAASCCRAALEAATNDSRKTRSSTG